MPWEKVIVLDELNQKQRTVFKKGPKQIAIFKVGENIYAIDNRCPHQGYPLLEGSIEESHVTCHWHHWKFDLNSGRCLTGGDDVRNYKTKVEENAVWIDLSEPSKEEVEKTILSGLKTAVEKNKYGRTSRELARLYFNKIDPRGAVQKSIEWSYDKLKEGTTHAYAALADWLTLYQENKNHDENQIICLTEAIDHISHDVFGQKNYPYATQKEPFGKEDFLQAIEEENEEKATSQILGALDAGLHFQDLEEVFVHAALMHYNDFGHSAIYVYKTGKLLNVLGTEVERHLILSLTRHLCHTTREDLIPTFKPHLVQTYKTHFEDSARNLLYFNLDFEFAYKNPVSDNVSWLDVTHPITFSNAIRNLCSKYPKFWEKGLAQLAYFNGGNSPYINLNQDMSLWVVSDTQTFFKDCIEKILDHGIEDNIYAAHWLKTFCAVREEFPHVSESCQKTLLAGLNRFLNSPRKEKHVRRSARQNIQLIKKDF